MSDASIDNYVLAGSDDSALYSEGFIEPGKRHPKIWYLKHSKVDEKRSGVVGKVAKKCSDLVHQNVLAVFEKEKENRFISENAVMADGMPSLLSPSSSSLFFFFSLLSPSSPSLFSFFSLPPLSLLPNMTILLSYDVALL